MNAEVAQSHLLAAIALLTKAEARCTVGVRSMEDIRSVVHDALTQVGLALGALALGALRKEGAK